MKMDSSCNNKRNSFEPGWNDPPKISYDTMQSTLNRPRNFLNKRVAFPLDNNIQLSNSSKPSLPVSICNSMPKANISTETITVSDSVEIDSETMLNDVFNILTKLVESCDELGSKCKEIKKRIDIMKEMWLAGQLDKNVQVKMAEIASAIGKEEFHKADEIHKALMVDHVSVVGTWMPGIKQLILHGIARQELLDIDKE